MQYSKLNIAIIRKNILHCLSMKKKQNVEFIVKAKAIPKKRKSVIFGSPISCTKIERITNNRTALIKAPILSTKKSFFGFEENVSTKNFNLFCIFE